jgi:hypothetical protein
MIVQNTSIDGSTDISFTLPLGDIATALPILEKVGDEVGAKGVSQDANIVKLSLVGAGMKSSPGIAAKMFRVLADNDVNIEMISTSTIRISEVGCNASCRMHAHAPGVRNSPPGEVPATEQRLAQLPTRSFDQQVGFSITRPASN